MKVEKWYYQYSVKFWDEDDKTEKFFSGIVLAKNMSNAVKHLENYYGEDYLMDILSLKALDSGPVFEFNYASNLDECDFTFCRKI